jgi:hypothetical protein
METVKAYNERERRENAQEWRRYHEDQAERHRRTLEALISHHMAAAQRLLEPEQMDQGEGVS